MGCSALLSYFVQIRLPAPVGIQRIGEGTVTGVGALGRRVGRVGGRRADDPCFASQKPQRLRHRITETVKEEDVVRADLGAVARIDARGQKFAARRLASSGTIGVGRVVPHQVGHDVLDPVRNPFTFLDGVPDVLPRHRDAKGLKTPGLFDDLADGVGEFPGADVNDVASHVSSQTPTERCPGAPPGRGGYYRSRLVRRPNGD